MKTVLVPTLTLALCIVLGAATRAAQDTPPNPAAVKTSSITAEQILDKYVDVTGGKEAYEKLYSRVVKGTLELQAQGIKAEIEIFQKAPNRSLEATAIAGYGTVTKGYDGTIGWTQDPFQGVRELSGVELASLKRSATFHSELRWRELYPKVELVGKQKVEDREVYVVRLTPSEGSPVTDYYDIESFLLLGHDSTEEGPQGKVPVESYPTNYREVDGIKAPFVLKQKSPIGQATVTITSVTHNVEVPDTKFAKPAK